MHRRPLLAAPLALALPRSIRASTALDVVYPLLAERPRDAYGYRLLELALKHCGEPYSLRLAAQAVSPERTRLLLEQGELSVYDFGLSPEAEARFAPVYFPLDLGLSGYRRLLIRRDRESEFAGLRTVADLRPFSAGQGLGWTDTRILQNAGVRVHSAAFEALMRMLEAGRFDFFPLGIEEADALLATHRHLAPSVTVLRSPLLHYPFARLFYVSPRQPRLRNALLRGLARAEAEGAVRKLLMGIPAFAAMLEPRADAAVGQVIELPNPWLSDAFRAMPQRWFAQPIRPT